MGASRPVTITVAAIVGILLLAGTALAQGAYDVAEIIRLVEANSGMPDRVRVNQSITLRAFLFTWRVRSTLEHVGGEITATTYGNPPDFMPASFPVELVTLDQRLSMFELELLPERTSEGYLVLGGPRIGFDGSGAQEATLMVDPNDWRVKQATLKYPWGTIAVDQEYGPFLGYTLLRRQRGVIRPYGAVVEVEYSDYALL